MDIQLIITLGIGAALLVVLFIYWKKIREFVSQVLVELKKVSWPTRKELFDSTWIVLISSIVMAVFIGSTDFVLSKFLSIIISR